MQNQGVEKGTFIGGTLLVAGSCIGAGMLGLPVLSAAAGFIPSTVIFLVCWLFMVCTGLLLLEVNLWFGQEISIVTMAERTLGQAGKWVSGAMFLFLFYTLMVAYIAASGSLVTDFIESFTNSHLDNWVGSLAFTLLFGVLIYIGTHAVDHFNRLLMIGLILVYFLLVAMGAQHVDTGLLQHREWSAMTLVIPAVIISFGFHNLVPSLTTYFKGNVRSLRSAILLGSSIPLMIYIIWEWLILGIVPLKDFQYALDHGEIATEALKTAVGNSWILDIAQSFAFFAVITSFLGVALSFVDFLADGLKIKKTPQGKVLLCALVLVPPYICALMYPTIFLSALNYAGGFGAVILFGILPALMVWMGRYRMHFKQQELVPGGKPLLILVILFSLWVIGLQIV